METVIGNAFSGEFKLIRLLGKDLISGYVQLKIDIEFDSDSTRAQQALTLKSMKKWLTEIFDGSIAFNVKQDFPTETFEFLNNHVMFCPEEPYDFLIMTLVYAKLNAIGNGHVYVENIELSSDIGDGFSNWLQGSVDAFLPNSDDWLGEHKHFEQPWWHRPDGAMVEVWAESADDLKNKPNIEIPLDDVDISNIVEDIEEFSAEIIRPNFKPNLVKSD